MVADPLLLDIESASESCYSGGRRNHITDLVLLIGGITLSLVATVLAATPDVPRPLAAGFAALPALCATLRTSVDFRGRAGWYFLKAARLQALALGLKFAADSEAVPRVAKQLGELEIDMEQQWPKFVTERGSAPSHAKSVPRRNQ
jgi:hypothetical protein